jgi:hypothetical protein
MKDERPAGPGGHLFLASTPLHTFFALGLMSGPFRDGPNRLWLIDQPPGVRDHLGEAIEASGSLAVEVRRFAALRGTGPARAELRRISGLAAQAAPSTIAVGMDHRLEFHAAIRGCPLARRIYIDDGLYSYLPHQHAKPAWREWLTNVRRSLKYGVRSERPSLVGGSRAVQGAYVLLPAHVHAGLAGKPVQALEPGWFAEPVVERLCLAAAELAGFDASRCASIGLLVLLPHPRFLIADPTLKAQLATLARQHRQRGETVALKSHPNAAQPAHEQLGLPAGVALEVPARLPAEVLAPLLQDAKVVGSLTTALLSLALLGHSLQVFRLAGAGAGTGDFGAGAQRVYDAAGVKVFGADPTV